MSDNEKIEIGKILEYLKTTGEISRYEFGEDKKKIKVYTKQKDFYDLDYLRFSIIATIDIIVCDFDFDIEIISM